MANSQIKTRIIHKHDTAANWELAVNFIPKQGEIIIYDKDSTYNHERFKIGDGATLISALPFANDALKAEIQTLLNGKASVSSVTQLSNRVDGKVDKDGSKVLSTNDFTNTLKSKLDGIASGAQVNQNAFSNITDGTTTIAADSTTDTLTLVAGSNISLALDATNDKVTISATNATYDAAGSSLGLVKSGGDVTISSGVITVNDDSHNHVISNVDGLQNALDAKVDKSDYETFKTNVNTLLDSDDETLDQMSEIVAYTKNNKGLIDSITTSKQDKITGAATTITGSNLTASRVLVSDSNGKVAASSSITTTELGYLDGVNSGIQNQLDTINTKFNEKATIKKWTSVLTINTWSRVAKVSLGGYGNFLFAISISQNSQATSNLFSIGTGYGSANITQLSTSNHSANNVMQIRLTRDDSSYTTFYIEILEPFGYNSATTVSATCKITQGVSTADPTVTSYTSYTASDSASKVVTTLQTQKDGIAIPKIYGSLTGDVSGNASSATKATQDASGNVITSTYATKTELGNKVDKVSGKGLSTNDFTTTLKNKLDGIAEGANNYSLPTASSTTKGGVKTGAAITDTTGYTAVHIKDGVIYYKDTNTNLVTSVFGRTGAVNLTKSDVTTALGYTPPTTDTNTHYTTRLYAGASGTAANAAATNPYLKITDDNTYRNQVRFVGSGATTVSSDANGNITISSTNTTYSAGAGLNLSGTSFSIKNHVFRGYDRNEIGTAPNFDTIDINGLFEVRSSSETTGESGTKPFNSFGPMLSFKYSNTMFQIAGAPDGLMWRGKQAANITLAGVSWATCLDSKNYTSYTVTKTGSGASGTWGISVTGSSASCTGNAATATKATQDASGNVITSTYLKLSGGTMSGKLTLNTSVADHATPMTQILCINCDSIPSGTTLTDKNAPGIGFHIGNNSWGSLILNNGNFKFINDSATGYMPVHASAFHGSGANLTSLNAGNISSGTLAVARGGTGITSNPSMLVNLGSTSAASVFAASPRPGVTGTLPITNGGTGATNKSGARTNLGITSGTSLPSSASAGDIFFLYS